MAIFNCPECQGTVSDKAPACPHCGAPIPAPAEATKADAPEAKAPPAAAKGPVYWILMLLAGFAGSYVAFGGLSKKPDTAAATTQPAKFTASDARDLCQTLIKQMSRDAEKAKVPTIPAAEKADSYIFVWSNQTQLVRLRNGLGIEVGVPAHCLVSKETQKVAMLAVDGKIIPLQ
ncbi:hypothetical protein [Comamonas terrigena]|uniref:hypothetical protein n=1 Tax=Comamonas terrigena TaxID=32013 RepID=UPI00244ADE44|nr:hypothetical protein [Comamonas terrigena]MDH0049649.1 hypothetical protein [Comamonas terrigena]MDH0511301.1 hypothetical protein [Comamonas terrigena]MDH1091396.1 hypothetical protein [Comamonas terrigena]